MYWAVHILSEHVASIILLLLKNSRRMCSGAISPGKRKHIQDQGLAQGHSFFFPSFFLLLQLFHTLYQIAMNHSNMPYIFVLVTKAGGINWDIDLSNYAETI